MSTHSVRDANARIGRLFDAERYADVIDLCTEMVGLFPNEWKFYYHRAHAKRILGRRNEAIDDMTVALGFQDKEPALYFFRGSWRVDVDNYLEGADDLKQAIVADADLGSSYYVESARFTRAIAFLHLGEFDEAKAACVGIRPEFSAYVKGRMWSVIEVLDRAQRRVRP